MLIVVDPHSGVPVYRQLMDQIKFHVASGLLPPGEALPSTRTLSSRLGVNPMTISKAYGFLEHEGVIARRPGRPLVVAAVRDEQLRDRKHEQLREKLSDTVRVVRQLGIPHAEALEVFAEMLGEAARDARSPVADEPSRPATETTPVADPASEEREEES